jgi:hypothetical protein
MDTTTAPMDVGRIARQGKGGRLKRRQPQWWMVPCSFAGAKGKVAAPAALIFGWGAHCNAGSKRGGPAFSQRAPDCLTARVASQLQCMRTSHSIRSDQDTLLAQFDSHSPVTFLPVGRLAGRHGPWSNSPSPLYPDRSDQAFRLIGFFFTMASPRAKSLRPRWCAGVRERALFVSFFVIQTNQPYSNALVWMSLPESSGFKRCICRVTAR